HLDLPSFPTRRSSDLIMSQDPVRLGVVASLARPDGNLTGVNFFAGELGAKRLELLRELVPGAARVAVVVNPASAAQNEFTLRELDRKSTRLNSSHVSI